MGLYIVISMIASIIMEKYCIWEYHNSERQAYMLSGLMILLLSPAFLKVLAAVLPAIYLLKYVYQTDRLEAESTQLLWRLVFMGMLSTAIATLVEICGQMWLDANVDPDTTKYNFILYFIIVAYAEEGGKYILLKRTTWNSPEFNCQYDGVVYAVFVSLGFALLENIKYIFTFGMSIALVRALTAIPGHLCFSIYMGVFYGAARRASNRGEGSASFVLRIFAIIIPAIIHGAYDFIATTSQTIGFFIFIGIMFFFTFKLIKNRSQHDRAI